MHRAIDYLMAAGIGSTISFMVVFNTRFGEVASMPVSFIFNHSIGIIIITIIMAFLRIRRGTPAVRQKAPWYLWFGGAFGFLILNANFITIVNIGASLAMATAVFGQSLGSLMFDLTGFMGRKTYPISRKKAFTLSVSFIGIAIMASQGGTFAIPYVVIGILTGVITMIQMVYNSRFAAYKGVFFSARNNVLSGLLIAITIYLFTAAEETVNAFSSLAEVPIYLMLGGGLLAIVVVSGTNHVIPRIPALYSALLLSSAQIITSIVIDYYLYDLFSGRLLLGAVIILLGMMGNVWVDWQDKTARGKPSVV
ncbi:DMT family transporter [Pleomorphochaeta sp. DL1XJH-081]|jgi:transporter family-2 protein|uniref:DMT family transporter n=1 Tax=Pleomorphochaeta sp. DL1XJH-081 TaxID=3409690 RepID=UPI003BB6ECAD